MRKIFIILCCFGILSAHATEMCARNDTVVIPLDAMINILSHSGNGPEALAWQNYEYGTLYFSVACLSKKEMMMYSNWNGTGNLPEFLNTADDELIGASGYYMNADTNPDIPDAEKGDYQRVYCVGKLIHPMSSNWAYLYGPTPAGTCLHNCATNLAAYSISSYQNRMRIFNSIGTQPPWEEE